MSSREIDLPAVAARLKRRYPHLHCQASRYESDDSPKGEGCWTVSFFAEDRQALIDCGIATADQFEIYDLLSYAKHYRHPLAVDDFGNSVTASPCPEGGFMVRMHIHDRSSDPKFSKKLQLQVDRALRPFVRGTWKPVKGIRS